MRLPKFFLFPITHGALSNKKENKGTPVAKARGPAALGEGPAMQRIEASKLASSSRARRRGAAAAARP